MCLYELDASDVGRLILYCVVWLMASEVSCRYEAHEQWLWLIKNYHHINRGDFCRNPPPVRRVGIPNHYQCHTVFIVMGEMDEFKKLCVGSGLGLWPFHYVSEF